MNRSPWTGADLAYLRQHYADTPTAEIAAHLGRTMSAVWARAAELGLTKSAAALRANGARVSQLPATVATRFRPGNRAWNAGTNYVAGGRSAETRYKAGNLNGRAAELAMPVGSYRINGDGYLDRKIGTTPGPSHRRWHPVHRLVWEAAHGPVPAGHVVVFRPGRRTTVLADITLDAVELVSRRELMARNTVHRLPKEVADAVQLIGAINRQLNKRIRRNEESNGRSEEPPVCDTRSVAG